MLGGFFSARRKASPPEGSGGHQGKHIKSLAHKGTQIVCFLAGAAPLIAANLLFSLARLSAGADGEVPPTSGGLALTLLPLRPILVNLSQQFSAALTNDERLAGWGKRL